MKIAFLVHDYHRQGGHSRYVVELATRFAVHHEVHVFANRIERSGAENIRFHHVPAWRANALTTVLSFALPVTFQVGRGFHVIHSQGFCGLRGNVFTAHICNRVWHRALQALEGGVTLRESVFNAIAGALEYALYRSRRKAIVIAVSERVGRDIAHSYHCNAPVRVVYHGVDLQLFSPLNRQCWRAEMRAQHGLADDEMVFLYVGDLRKGAQRCIRALSQTPFARLVFVSRTPPELYKRAAEEAGVDGRALFLGPTHQVEKMYALADAFVHPSPYDAFGMVVSEAMACGLPVVVSREAGASELIQHGINGLLIDDLSTELELARHMRALLENRAWARQLGDAGRSTVEALSWDAIASQTMQVYQELPGRSP